MMTPMKQQLLISVVVFTVGFGLGYGVTWLLVSKGDDDAASSEGPSSLPPKSAALTPPTPPAATPDAAEQPEPEAAADVQADAGPTAEADGEAVPEADAAAAASAEPDVPAAPAEPDVPPPPPRELPWWDRCVGKKCEVDFGELTGGLTVRKGSIEHGTRVDWTLRFGGAQRVDVIPTNRPLTVEVRGVGIGGDGKPTAAEIEYRKGGRTIVGIIALKIGNKRITMSPPAQPD